MLANSRKAPLCRVEQPAQEGADSAAQPVAQSACAGVGDRDAVAHICYDCATCLCVDDKLIKMPRFALANHMFLGREHPLLQDSTPGLRLLLGFGRPCFRKLLLGRGRREDRESGTTGNHILVSQGAPSASEVLPPTSSQLAKTFVAVFGQNKEDLAKCQLLTVSRHAYRTLAEERLRVNSCFGRKRLDHQAVDALPENGVPQQFIDCGAQMPEVDRYRSTRSGPGTIRDPLDAAKEDDNASDELSEKSGDECDAEEHDGECGDNEQHSSSLPGDMQLNSFETPLGLDPTASPDFVQHVRVCQTGRAPNSGK